MAQDERQRRVQTRAHVWDTDDYDPGQAYESYQGNVRDGFLRWTSKQTDKGPFKARFEALVVDDGFIGRIDSVPVVSTRTKADIATSPAEYFYASFVLSGSMLFEQHGKDHVARAGDLVVFDSSRTARVQNTPSHGRICSGAIALMIPKSSFSSIDAESYFTNVHFPRTTLLAPLSNILTFLSNRLASATGKELAAFYDACVDLLPVAAGCFDKRAPALEMRGTNGTLQEVLVFIKGSLGNPQLSATYAAGALGLSERYIHKLFARRGSTFSGYVTAARLEHVRDELVGAGRYKPISLIAYRWGFNDLSTFNRAFRRHFGCTPSVMRGSPGSDPTAD